MPKIPQPIPYQGSKRNTARQIIRTFPKKFSSLVEPFAGSAAISVATAYYQKANKFHLSDLNEPLINLFEKIINQPQQIADAYENLWNAQLGQERSYYDFIRNEFNHTHRPDYFLYLLARCVKASVRYNSEGEFNQSPDNRRKGRHPKSMRQEIFGVSQLLQGKTVVTCGDYKDSLNIITKSDLVYMDPPYQGTSQNKDPRYYSGLDVAELIDFLGELNDRQIMFILSYDGRTDEKTYGIDLPISLALHKTEICAGRSSQSTLLGGKAETIESLYLSPALIRQLRAEHKNIDALRISNKPSHETSSVQLALGIA